MKYSHQNKNFPPFLETVCVVSRGGLNEGNKERKREEGRRERPEVFGGFRGDVGEELHLDPASGDGADGDIEEDDGVLRVRGPQMPLHRRCSGTRRCRRRRRHCRRRVGRISRH